MSEGARPAPGVGELLPSPHPPSSQGPGGGREVSLLRRAEGLPVVTLVLVGSQDGVRRGLIQVLS